MFAHAQASAPANLNEETDPAAIRQEWVAWATKLAEPIFDALDKRELRLRMPVETRATHSYLTGPVGSPGGVTYLEALARLLAGIAPWLELGPDDTPEGQLRGQLAEAARRAIDAATDPSSPDRMTFGRYGQSLVDSAFLSLATFRAPRELWEKLEPRVQANLIACLKETRSVGFPGGSNWQFFPAFVELALARGGEPRDDSRLLPTLENFREWYLGDGYYGEPHFGWSYYNSYVIQPMLLGILDEVAHESEALRQFQREALAAAQRYAAVQERLIAPDGSFPALARSIVYRAGAFHLLADIALRRELPKPVIQRTEDGAVHIITPGAPPAAVRTALTRAMRRTLDAPGTFDENGWLQIGLSGHQPLLAESYLSTGSLYLCSVALLPLGLPPDDPFWSDPHEPTSSERLWSGDTDVWAPRSMGRLPAPETPLEVAVRAARWQLTQPDAINYLRRWEHGAFWAGMTVLADTDGAPADIREAVLKMGRDTRWQPNSGSLLHADNQTITQSYLWTARNGAGKEALAPTIAIFERLLAEAPRGPLSAVVPGTPGRWSWCDALFMAPPAMFQLSKQTGDMRYRDHALREWWATTDFLYDPVEKLYFRDKNYFERRDDQGNKIFWSRGNGWAFAAMARSLPLLEANSPDAQRMRGLFVEMAERLIELQKEDGYWSPSLLSPEGSPPETSGTGFFTYGLAWGINAGLLDRERFEPAVRKGWSALKRALHPNGKLGYVQQIGTGPRQAGKNDTQYYGTGALLMAASEITKLDAAKQ
ncbi:hypothetical protein AXK11_02295 [Cephaloticoccus primus]|uniref:DUF2264 domain-containing protein n=1 Tax=Cephaloticoccus primus TaxID=1548207 RepID=A0A139SSJ2_9BACT|nr:DUF2264 domain-containing protein [Cephaloticoccus primus]KXU37441.1 hypothetical protein AXK11_02295 [Cephaloticoccus primus]